MGPKELPFDLSDLPESQLLKKRAETGRPFYIKGWIINFDKDVDPKGEISWNILLTPPVGQGGGIRQLGLRTDEEMRILTGVWYNNGRGGQLQQGIPPTNLEKFLHPNLTKDNTP